MKKILISIITILGIGLSFCSADFSYSPNAISTSFSSNYNAFVYPAGYNCFMVAAGDGRIKLYDYSNNLVADGLSSYTLYCDISFYESTSTTNKTLQYFYIPISTSSGSGGNENTGSVNTGSEVFLPSTSYTNILNNSFGLFQYYFWNLLQILPYFLLIIGFISIFYFIFYKK